MINCWSQQRRVPRHPLRCWSWPGRGNGGFLVTRRGHHGRRQRSTASGLDKVSSVPIAMKRRGGTKIISCYILMILLTAVDSVWGRNNLLKAYEMKCFLNKNFDILAVIFLNTVSSNYDFIVNILIILLEIFKLILKWGWIKNYLLIFIIILLL